MKVATATGTPGGTGFGIENLPFGVARRAGGTTTVVSAFGPRVVDLAVLDRAGSFRHVDLPERIFEDASLNRFIECGREVLESVRRRLAELITAKDDRLESALVSRRAVDLLVPVEVGDFVDFYGSLHHAKNMGRLFRPSGDPLPKDWRRLPRAYHGRTASIVPSGTPVHRPYGQVPGDEPDVPVVGVTRALDFEVEVGFVIGEGNEPGRPVRAVRLRRPRGRAGPGQRLERPRHPGPGVAAAGPVPGQVVRHVGVALAGHPRRPRALPGGRPAAGPVPPAYLAAPPKSAFDIRLEVAIQSQWMRINNVPSVVVTRSCLADHYWTFPQMLAHATVNGAAVRPGDLFASGAVSGRKRGTEGSLMELAANGARPVALPDGTTRTFLEDGDTVTITGWAGGDDRPLLCVGEVSGSVRAARRLEV